ncbi:hypothetical protein [Pseudomonas chlororaphis]|uniref:hypothetical protein n=1 Tax=Pseudomonas chlororaphis TaxID=587753 RepID=UPI00131A4DC2|nr:hypothetical protein [Pseudomonas chlororaphis]
MSVTVPNRDRRGRKVLTVSSFLPTDQYKSSTYILKSADGQELLTYKPRPSRFFDYEFSPHRAEYDTSKGHAYGER